MRPTLILCLAALSAAACAEPPVAGPPGRPPLAASAPTPPESATAVAAVDDAAASTAAPSPAPPREITWTEAVRLERWNDAARLLDALPDGDAARPEIRYVRARVALQLADGARAVPLLTGLEGALPLLGADIERYRAEAQMLAGPYADAAAYFGKSAKPRDLGRAAEAHDKDGKLDLARAFADRAVAAAQRGKQGRDEPAMRLLRARLSEKKGGAGAVQAAADYRWIATHSPLSSEGLAAAEALERQKHPLSSKERLAAVESSTDANTCSETAATLQKLAQAPDLPRGALLHTRAMALYKARDYGEAAKVFAASAASHVPTQAEDLFYAARSLSRAGHDEEAIKHFVALRAGFRKSPFAERGAYLLARLYLQAGKYKEAIQAYTQYYAGLHKGAARDDAEYEKALALLAADDPKAARKSLGELAHRAHGDEASRLRELEAVAAFRAGDRDAALGTWTDLAASEPLSWAAIASRARLTAAGAPVPPLRDPPAAPATTPVTPELPPAAALLVSLGLDADAEGYLLAAEREVSARYAGREGEALCALYGQLDQAKRRYRVGAWAIGDVLTRAPSTADRWAWECVYPRPYAGQVSELEQRHQLPRGLLYAVMRQESTFDPAIVSPASAVGLMQLMPATAKQVCSELSIDFDPLRLTSPGTNLRLGAFYVDKLLKTFQGSVVLAAAAYNAGPKAVSHWLEEGTDTDADLWVARIPYDETRHYVARVVSNMARYQWLEGGESQVTPLPLALPSGARAASDAY